MVRPRIARGSLTPLAVVAIALFLAVLGWGASLAEGRSLVPKLDWVHCAKGAQCATARVPKNYARPNGPRIKLALVRLRATDKKRRIGSLFVNFGGPGETAVDYVRDYGKELFASLNDRFDIVGFDPRGVGASEPAVDCRVNQETHGIGAQPTTTPANLDVARLVKQDKRYIQHCRERNRGILRYLSTANVARDLDLLRAAVGDDKLSYLGYSYGTFLGATYSSLFPDRIRALVLDGAVDPDQYINDPLNASREQTAGFELALHRFFRACAAQQDVCLFGGADPETAFDALVARLDEAPIPAGGSDPRPINGDDVREATFGELYAKQFWPELAIALATAQAGDGTLFRELVDYSYGRYDDGTYDPSTDQFYVISALEERWPSDVQTFLDAGAESFANYPHFWSNNGYSELIWGLYPVEPRGVFYGPFRNPAEAPTTLVVGTTYDPATPYADAGRMVAQLGNARLLTMDGDGHTAYGGNSPCIDHAVDAYLDDGVLPPEGTVCPQDVPFALPDLRSLRTVLRKHVFPAVRLRRGP